MKYRVSGEGMYHFSNLPDKYQVTHDTYKSAYDFMRSMAYELSQSWLLFYIWKWDGNEWI